LVVKFWKGEKTIMKTLILSAVLVLVVFGAANAQITFPSSWLGNYETEESGMNATGTRSFSSWAKIEISCSESCEAIYTDGENSDTYNKFTMTVKGTANSISLYYSICMPVEYGSSEPCTNSYKEGDLMFKLVKGKAVKGKSTITTVWGKLKKESSGGVFFKKVKK
jgi:Family of unknown function (DUF5991)